MVNDDFNDRVFWGLFFIKVKEVAICLCEITFMR